MHSTWLRNYFLRVFKFLQIKAGDLISGREPILQKVWIIWSPGLYFNFKSFKDPNSSSFIRFQWILFYSGVPFSDFWSLEKLKRGDLISRENQLCRKSELLGPPFSISILNVLWTQILHHRSLPKSPIFQWTSKILKFFILNTISSFKRN